MQTLIITKILLFSMVPDDELINVLDKIESYEQSLIELCSVIQSGFMQISKAQCHSGKIFLSLKEL